MFKHNRINPFAVVIVGEGKKIICPSAVQFRHSAAVLHISAQYLDQLVVRMADLAKAHRLIEESPLFVMLGDIVMVQVDNWFPHVGEIKLHAGEICYHQCSFAEDLFITHIPNGRNDLDNIVPVKIVMLRTDDRMKDVLDAVTVCSGG